MALPPPRRQGLLFANTSYSEYAAHIEIFWYPEYSQWLQHPTDEILPELGSTRSTYPQYRTLKYLKYSSTAVLIPEILQVWQYPQYIISKCCEYSQYPAAYSCHEYSSNTASTWSTWSIFSRKYFTLLRGTGMLCGRFCGRFCGRVPKPKTVLSETLGREPSGSIGLCLDRRSYQGIYYNHPY